MFKYIFSKLNKEVHLFKI